MEILSFFIYFILSAVISFGGTLQLGPVNLAVIYNAIHKGFKSALLTGLGGSLPELFYSAAAFWFAHLLVQYPLIWKTIYITSIPIFLFVGTYLLVRKAKPKEDVEIKKSSYPLLSGFILGTLNPMLLPFWIMVIQYLREYGFDAQQNLFAQVGFILGTASGAFSLHFILAKLIRNNQERFKEKFLKYADPITGIAFIIVAIIQGVNAWYKL